MSVFESLAGAGTSLRRGTVVRMTADGACVADCLAPHAEWTCELLDREDVRELGEGEAVLFVPPGDTLPKGVVLGRLGRRSDAAASSNGDGTDPLSVPSPAPPDELVIEAKQSLTLRVGNGSITIREDGRILIKGKDLVSHATRRNRIKGASVEIN